MRRGSGHARLGGYGRTALIGLASAGLLLATLGTASGQTAPPTKGKFNNGTAKATAVVARIAPGVGSLELGTSAGVAVAELKNTIAQAQAKAFDLGLIGTTLTAEGCGGSDAAVTPGQLPQPTRVDSRRGEASLTGDEIPIAGTTLGGGRKYAHASPAPEADALAKVAGAVSPAFSFDGGRAEASTRVVGGAAREARAKVSVDLDIGGVLQLSGLRWNAFHRTGKDPMADASFDVGSADLLGVALPLDSLSALETAMNEVLAPSGITITLPKVERLTTPVDLVRVTPLRLVLKDTPAGKTTLGPALNLGRAQREELFVQLASARCDLAGALLVGDIGLAIVSGTGFLAVEFGGAEAITGDLVLESPFTSGAAPSTLEIPDVLRPAVASGLPTLPGPVAAGPVGTVGTSTVRPAASIGPLEDRCESRHPLRQTACSQGALLAAGLIGMAATAGVGALDWRHQRRRRARIVTGRSA